MNKFIVLTIASAMSATILATPVFSQDVVVGRSTADFVSAVSADLDRQLATASRWQRREPGSGIAIVRFRCGKDGAPERIALFRSSGDRSIDTAAIRAVSRLTSLHSLPGGMLDGQLVQTNIVFADDLREHARLSRKLAREEAERLASSSKERTVLAFNVVANPNS